MMHAGAAEKMYEANTLFDRIGAFLAQHGLSDDPVHYSFVHAALSEPDGPIGRAVARLVDGGVRLQPDDIARLGGPTSPPRAPAAPVRSSASSAEAQNDRLVAETQAQVQGFADVVKAMQATTRGFGRDLEESAAAITEGATTAGKDEIARITGTMITRIHDTESRLAQATAEADTLRIKLAEARDTARRDPLTGLANRLAFEEAFAASGTTADVRCLAVCDVDRFKRVNDDHGHAVGDRVLSAIAQALADGCKGHMVARHGGEEFAILFHGISLDDANALLETAREVVGHKRFRKRDTGHSIGRVTISAGLTQIAPDERGDDAFARADRLLYCAKAEGRDRICLE